MASQADVSSQIIAALAVSEPDLDTSVGSVTRKIIDAVAASVAGATLDSQMLSYQYDVNSMSGAALDAFVQLFGMSRYPAARATGTVTFTRGTATDVVTIPVATQVATTDGSVVAQAITAGIMDPAALSVTVPVQAVVAGPQGNVPAGTLTQLMTALSEITSATNVGALAGGANQETDTQLAARWKATVFKSMAGTSQMFLGIALNDPQCTAANVIDGATRFREQLQVSGGQAASTVSDAQYTYPSGQVVGRDIDAGDVAAPGVQYTWSSSANPPRVTVIDGAYFPDGQLIDVSFLYMDVYSRNSPAAGIFNRVDVWCAGQRPRSAAATVRFSNATTFQASPSSAWYAGSFIRPDGSQPATGNTFMPQPYGPVLTVPPLIVVNGVTYGLASLTHPLGTTSGGVQYSYQVVHRTGAYGWSPYSDFGLEWKSGSQPPNGAAVVISEDYAYNDVVHSVQGALENWRLAGTDVQAHQGIQVFLQFSLAVIYDPTISQQVTTAAISSALQLYLSGLGFSSRIYPSSVIQAVENTPGVIASRFLTGADYPGWSPSAPNDFDVGIQAVFNGVVVQSYVSSAGDPVDVELGAAQMPAFGGTVIVPRAGNTMGAFA